MENVIDTKGQTQKKTPGEEFLMDPQPVIIRDGYKVSEKLKGKVAIITGGDFPHPHSRSFCGLIALSFSLDC